MKSPKHNAGFTLVELAIVLVIIGLIVGGVLVGQDLIKAAEIRATTSDLEKYNAAANTFRNKYNGLPGDLLAQRALQFGLITRNGTAGQGDGNSVMEGCAERVTALGCETGLFWVDLTAADLMGDAFNVGAGANDGLANGNAFAVSINTTAALGRFVPSTPLRDSSFVHVFPQGGRNFFFLGNFDTTAVGAITVDTTNGGMSAAESSQIDDKIDDGVPSTGVVRAVSAMTASTGATVDPGANGNITGACVEEGATAGGGAGIENDESYNTVLDDFANELNCNLYVRTSF